MASSQFPSSLITLPIGEPGPRSGVGFHLPLPALHQRWESHLPTPAAPTSPSRSQNLSATDNTLLFLNDPHPSGEGMRKPPGKVLRASDAGKEGSGELCKSLLGKLVPRGHRLALGWASRQRKFSGTGQRGALLGESLGIVFLGIL